MSGNTGMFNGQPLIRVQDLGKSFGSIDVLKGITVDIHKGDVVFVVGPSGSGKSTFLRCLNLLEEPTSGHIFFEGTDITDPKTDIDKHRQKMGMVFQQFNLFPHMDIMKNLTIAPIKLQGKGQKEAEDEAMELLERVGLADGRRGIKRYARPCQGKDDHGGGDTRDGLCQRGSHQGYVHGRGALYGGSRTGGILLQP